MLSADVEGYTDKYPRSASPDWKQRNRYEPEKKSDARCTKKQIISSGGSGSLTICL